MIKVLDSSKKKLYIDFFVSFYWSSFRAYTTKYVRMPMVSQKYNVQIHNSYFCWQFGLFQSNLQTNLKVRKFWKQILVSSIHKFVYLRRGIVSYFFVLGRVLRHFCNVLLYNKGSIKHCRNVLGRFLGRKNKIQNRSFSKLKKKVWDFFKL